MDEGFAIAAKLQQLPDAYDNFFAVFAVVPNAGYWKTVQG